MTHKYFSLMTKLSNISGRFFAMAILASVASAAFAQDYYYDDDIYYDASKAKKEQKKQIKKQASDNTRLLPIMLPPTHTVCRPRRSTLMSTHITVAGSFSCRIA